MTHQAPIESQFVKMLTDNLNAEIVLGTVSNVQEVRLAVDAVGRQGAAHRRRRAASAGATGGRRSSG